MACGGDETKLISTGPVAAELSMSEATEEDAADAGQVGAANGDVNAEESLELITALPFQDAEIGCAV